MSAIATVSPKTIWIAVEVTGARSKGQSSLCSGKCTFMSHAAARAFPWTDVTEISKAPLALAQGTSLRSSSVLPDLLKRTRMSLAVRMPMSPWRASTGERKPERTARETRVWEILRATKPDLPTPEKKIVPRQLRRVWVKARVWERSRLRKKKLRWSCWDLKRLRSALGSMRDWGCLGGECGKWWSDDDAGKEPITVGVGGGGGEWLFSDRGSRRSQRVSVISVWPISVVSRVVISRKKERISRKRKKHAVIWL